ncbi:RNA polymerase sigma factor [Luteibacter aegosomatissinici]|uniref:RNA polymerase sigma factor n=1 Tax=Luteibacter aegosomatissinici TaxID=2911539 RepID=UPI001FF918B9|nr:RNA polymerase sigma factor [Luteibacter aegosomatissinici]UPG94692.1 RNA polymerase sigma factor [Luteibacter aegosomatissinici]
MADHVHRAIDAIWKIESPRLIATIARMVRDLDLAEELAQDALVAALEQWPRDGVPRNAGAWLTQAAKHRAVDRIRRERMAGRKLEALGQDMEGLLESHDDALIDALDDDIGDDMLRLIFTACHPALSVEAQVALTLRLLGGLTTDEIARAFLVPDATVAQRIVRAKRTLAGEAVVYEVPRGDELKERLVAVLRVVYLVFNEGYAATAGEDWMRPGLCEEALRLGRIIAELMPREAEVHGLVALMEIQASRAGARTRANGEPILLMDQDRGRWDRLLIQRGLTALERAERLGGARGPYALQAAIAACHARAPRGEDTDWRRIASLYAELVDVMPSPVVELNRAVAVSMADGPGPALAIVDALIDEPALKDYHLLPSVRGDLLFRLGQFNAAREAFLQAAGMTRNERERHLLESRAAACSRA